MYIPFPFPLRRGVKKISEWVLKIAFEHWLTHLTERGIASDIARWRIAPKKYLEHKIGMQVRAIVATVARAPTVATVAPTVATVAPTVVIVARSLN